MHHHRKSSSPTNSFVGYNLVIHTAYTLLFVSLNISKLCSAFLTSSQLHQLKEIEDDREQQQRMQHNLLRSSSLESQKMVVLKRHSSEPINSSNDDGDSSCSSNNDECNKRIDEISAKLSAPNFLLPSSYNGRASLLLFSQNTFKLPQDFSFNKSTQQNYSVRNKEYYGPFRDIRRSLDYDYHGNYSESRQEFQDKIVEKLLDGTTIKDETNGRVCKTPTEPWIVFTAGVMGAGKSHTMKEVASKKLFPLESYIIIDPDETRSHFPEYHLYARSNPERAGELTHREAGYVTEIVTTAALDRGFNVLVDGSLWDHEWYEQYFKALRRKYKVLRIAIIHITAPRDAIFERAKNRAKDTGRVVPIETLEHSLEQVPISVKKLAPLTDFFCELDNSVGEVVIKHPTWDDFRDNWSQTCPWIPPNREDDKRFHAQLRSTM